MLNSRDIRRSACWFSVAAVFIASYQLGCGKTSGPLPLDSPGPVTKSREVVNEMVPLRDTLSVQEAKMLGVDDPTQDGWKTEVLHKNCKAQLKKVAKELAHAPTAKELAPYFTPDVKSSHLRPENLETAFEDSTFAVRRAIERTGDNQSPKKLEGAQQFEGIDGFIKAHKATTEQFINPRDIEITFKIFQIDAPEDGSIVTRQYVATNGIADGKRFEQHSTWLVHWDSSDEEHPRIRSIDVEQFEESTVVVTEKKLFAECTEAVLQKNDCFQKELLRDVSHWMSRIQLFDIEGLQGVSIADVNGDGLEDVYLCQSRGLPNRLFLQQPDGTAVESAAESHVDWIDHCDSALFVDLDNDGDQDLVICMNPHTLVMANKGKGVFEVTAELTETDVSNFAIAADYDSDGDLDLYVGTYDGTTNLVPEVGGPSTFHNATNGRKNFLFRNDGDWKFTDVTEEVGLEANNRRWTYAAVWEDYDNDGDPDLYVANDFGPNSLYRNDGGKFVEVAESIGAMDQKNGMSVSWSDYNRDGNMDLYISNMFSSAGNRIAPKSKFRPDSKSELRSMLLGMARGNTLLKNTGGKFEDVSVPARVTLGRWAWGSNFLDVNNDGWDDLLVANGYVTGPRKADDL